MEDLGFKLQSEAVKLLFLRERIQSSIFQTELELDN